MSDKGYLGTDLFWRDIHDYIAQKKDKIRLDRESARKKSVKRMCPSCVTVTMEMVNVNNILVDKCPKCGGIYLDKGELELLFKTSEKSSFIGTIKRELFSSGK